jgi:RNA polymerase sigma-70 factor (ECF subfamily)
MELHERSEKCREVFSLLSEYLNLELPTDACQEIEAHLAGCPPCIEFAESLRKTVELCGHYQPSELPEPIGKNARQQLLDAYQRMLGARKSTSS